MALNEAITVLPSQGVEDMITLNNLSEDLLLDNIRRRYNHDLIYTYTGSILVSINPFQRLPIYTPALVKQYIGQHLGALPPHIFAIANHTYTNLLAHNRNQSCIISGESGAGKTEATKLMLQFLAQRTNKHSVVETKILQTNPVLEAFGNAATVRNNNSSRFGKFMEVHFTDDGSTIMGARLQNYLLEKSRIVFQTEGERNYHVFYMMLAGTSPEEKERYQLGSPQDFFYTNQSSVMTLPEVDDGDDWQRMKAAMSLLGLDANMQDQIFSVLAAILHLGNIRFKDGSPLTFVDPQRIDVIAYLLQMDSKALQNALRIKTLSMGNKGEEVKKPLTVPEAEDVRDAFSKMLYSRMFSWLVERMNIAIAGSVNSAKNSKFIGILDIFGFENFAVNSFEQMCINFANEKLQQFFNEHIFKLEQAEYTAEGIDWTAISFNDNQECLDLIEARPLGILSLLDEETRFPKATDQTLLLKIQTNHRKHKHFEDTRRTPNSFGIKHYAGEVCYTLKGFLEKNRDTVNNDLLAAVNTTKLSLVRELFREPPADPRGGPAKRVIATVGGNFKAQLDQLVTTLKNTEPHYVRCIKPNTAKAPRTFDGDMVAAQLRYAGMMETIRIRQVGFPIRYLFEDFYKRYSCLLSGTRLPASQWREACVQIVKKFLPEAAVGKTKVFLKEKHLAIVDEAKATALRSYAVSIQTWWRGRMYRTRFLAQRRSAVKLQAAVRGYQRRKRFVELRRATLLCQSLERMRVRRTRYLRTKRAAIVLQKFTRRWKAKKVLKKLKAKKQRMLAIQMAKSEEERRRLEQEEQRVQAQEAEAERLELEAAERRRLHRECVDEEERQKIAALVQEEEFGTEGAGHLNNIRGGLDDNSSRSSTLSQARSRAPSFGTATGAQAVRKRGPSFRIASPSESLKQATLGRRAAKHGVLGMQFEFKELPVLQMTEEEIPSYSLFQYASAHFEPPKKKTLTKRKTNTITDLTTCSAKPLSSNLTKEAAPVAKEAVDLSKKILTYMCTEEPSICGYVIRKALTLSNLRDELFCQLMRMTENNPSIEAAIRIWKMIAACCCCFLPSDQFKKTLFAFLLQHANDKQAGGMKVDTAKPKKRLAPVVLQNDNIGRLATFSMRSLRRTYQNGIRQMPPSDEEVIAVTSLRKLVVPFWTLDSQSCDVQFDSATTVAEATYEFMQKKGLRYARGWDLFIVYNDQLLKTLPKEERLADTLSRYEEIKKTMFKHKGIEVASQFIFKKHIFLDGERDIVDDVEANLLCFQAHHDIITGTMPVTVDEACYFAAAQLQFELGDYNPFKDISQFFPRILPSYLINVQSSAVWVEQIRSAQQALIGKSADTCKKLYLDMAISLPFYGFTFFSVKCPPDTQVLGINLPAELDLLISRSRLVLYDPKTRKQLCEFPLTDIVEWSWSPGDVLLTVYDLGRTYKDIVFRSPVPEDVVDAIRTYVRARKETSTIAVAITDYEVNDQLLLSFKKNQRINLKERYADGWCYGECNGCEAMFPMSAIRILVDDRDMPAPRQDEDKVSTQASVPSLSGNSRRKFSLVQAGGEYTLRRWANSNLSKKPNKGVMATLKRPSATSFQFSPSPIQVPLLHNLPEGQHMVAVAIFKNVMRYMGDLPQGGIDKSTLLRDIMAAGIQFPELRDEIYAQVIKQITNNPSPENKVEGFRFLMVTTGIFAPANSFIRYLQQFLLEAMLAQAVDAKSAAIARLALDSLNKTFERGPRLYPPSQAELEAVRQNVPLTCRIELPDGEVKHIPITPQLTTADVVKIVINDVSLPQTYAAGWGIWESSESGIMPLCSDTKLCDVMVAWEHNTSSALYRSRESVLPSPRTQSPRSSGPISPRGTPTIDAAAAEPYQRPTTMSLKKRMTNTLRKSRKPSEPAPAEELAPPSSMGTAPVPPIAIPAHGGSSSSSSQSTPSFAPDSYEGLDSSGAFSVRRNASSPSVFETLRRNKRSAVVKQEVEEKPASFAFLFRKTYWGVKEILSPEVLAHDKIAHHYLFQQMMNTFLNDRIPIEENWATSLAALVYQAKLMPEGIRLTQKTVVDTIPIKMVSLHTPAEWLELVEQSLAKVGSLSPAAAENEFIRAYAASNLYGAVAFPTLTKGLKLPSKALIIFGPSHVRVYELDGTTLLEEWEYSSISSFTRMADGWVIVVGDLFKPEVYTFQSPWAKEVDEVYQRLLATATGSA